MKLFDDFRARNKLVVACTGVKIRKCGAAASSSWKCTRATSLTYYLPGQAGSVPQKGTIAGYIAAVHTLIAAAELWLAAGRADHRNVPHQLAVGGEEAAARVSCSRCTGCTLSVDPAWSATIRPCFLRLPPEPKFADQNCVSKLRA